MKDYSIVVQNTTDKKYFTSGFTDLEDSKIYYHIADFVFPAGYADGEYRYYVLPQTDQEITVENNHIFANGMEISPLSTGLMVLGNYKRPVNEYNNITTYKQYEQ